MIQRLLLCSTVIIPCSIFDIPPLAAQIRDSSEQTASTENASTMILVTGRPGGEEFAEQFTEWADRFATAAQAGGLDVVRIGIDPEGETNDRDRLRKAIAEAAKRGNAPLWIVLIGHGTFDRRTARFNLHGPDVSAAEMADWLQPLERPVAVLNCASASAPFLNRLAGDERVIVSATKSGAEQNFARFGDYLSQTIADPAADLDKDGQTSLLEAFLSASRRTQEFYDTEARLATEHALLDDNGDGYGVRADFFRGVRAVKTPEDGKPIDGRRAHQWHLVPSPAERRWPPDLRRRRDELELQVFALRDRKEELPAAEYQERLESLLVPIAELYERVDELGDAPAEQPVPAAASR